MPIIPGHDQTADMLINNYCESHIWLVLKLGLAAKCSHSQCGALALQCGQNYFEDS